MIPVSSKVDPDLTVVMRAHQLVNRWQRLRPRPPFAEVLQHSLDQPGDPFLTTDVKTAIWRVAEAIRDGKGHAFSNRGPLLAITRRTLVR